MTMDSSQSVSLKRSIGLMTGCSIIIGRIIGSGIFVTPQGVFLGAGSYGLSLIIWAICGVLSMCGALAYVEMGTLIPKSGSGYYYLKEVYGDGAAFVYMFAYIFCISPGGAAAVSLTCAEYLTTTFFNDNCGTPPENIRQALAVGFILLAAAINTRSVILSGKIAVIFTAAKISALIIIILGGFIKLGQGFSDYLSPDKSFDGTNTDAASLASAFLSGMFAYSGWDSLSFLIEELKEPAKNLPRAVFISIPLVTVVYLLANVSYFTVVSPDELAESVAVAMTWALYVIPNVFWFVPIAVAMSTFGNSCASQLANTRLLFVAAREGHLPEVLSMIQVNHFTPAPAVILFASVTILYIFMGTIGELIAFTSSIQWLFHGMVGVGLLILRVTKKDVHRDFKAPLICPIVLIAFSIFLFLGPIVGDPQWGHFVGVIVLITATLLWIMMVKFRLHLPMDLITEKLQLFLQVSPTQSQAVEEEDSTIHGTVYIVDANTTKL